MSLTKVYKCSYLRCNDKQYDYIYSDFIENYLNRNDLSRPTNYYYVRRHLDFDDFVKYLLNVKKVRLGYLRIFDKNNNNHFRYTLPIEINLIHKLFPIEIKLRRCITGLGTTYFHMRILEDNVTNDSLYNSNTVNNKRIEYYNELMELINERNNIEHYNELTNIDPYYFKTNELLDHFKTKYITITKVKINNIIMTESEYSKLMNTIRWNDIHTETILNRIYQLPNPDMPFDLE